MKPYYRHLQYGPESTHWGLEGSLGKGRAARGEILSGKEAAEEADPLQCRFHDLRHTAVTRLLEAGIPYPVVACFMGWSAATAIRMAKTLRAHRKPSAP